MKTLLIHSTTCLCLLCAAVMATCRIELAKFLRYGTSNVYQVAERMFGETFGEEIFEDLREIVGLQRCPECSVWKDVEAYRRGQGMAPEGDGSLCNQCVEEIDED